MLYVIQKGNQYIRLSDTGKVDTVGLKKGDKILRWMKQEEQS